MLRLVRIDKEQCLLKLRQSWRLCKMNRNKSNINVFLSRNNFDSRRVTFFLSQFCVNVYFPHTKPYLPIPVAQSCLRRSFAAARLLGLRVRIPPCTWISVSWECCVLSGRGRVDHSSRGVLPSVMCLSVIVNPPQWGGPGPLGGCFFMKTISCLD